MIYNVRRSTRIQEFTHAAPHPPAHVVAAANVMALAQASSDDLPSVSAQAAPENVPSESESSPSLADPSELSNADVGAHVDDSDVPVDDPPALAPPVKRGPGRPRKNCDAEPSIDDLFNEDFDAVDFSLTIVSKGKHVPPVWHRAIYEFARTYGTRGAFALERGGKNENLHIQATVTFRSATDKAAVEKLKKAMKSALGARRGDGLLW